MEDTDRGRKGPGQPQRGAGQVELDDLGRTGADEKQQTNVGPPRNQLRHDAVEFVVGIGQSGEILLFHDRGGKSRLGEDHHAGGGLDEMRAGARPHHQEESVLDLPVQPDNARQSAKHFALAAFAVDLLARDVGTDAAALHKRVHASLPETGGAETGIRRSSRRAARSFRTNCVALTK